MKLHEILKETESNLLPTSFPKEAVNAKVAEYGLMDDDATGSQYHSKLFFKLENDQTYSIKLQEVNNMSLEQRNTVLDEAGKGNMESLNQLNKDFFKEVNQQSITDQFTSNYQNTLKNEVHVWLFKEENVEPVNYDLLKDFDSKNNLEVQQSQRVDSLKSLLQDSESLVEHYNKINNIFLKQDNSFPYHSEEVFYRTLAEKIQEKIFNLTNNFKDEIKYEYKSIFTNAKNEQMIEMNLDIKANKALDSIPKYKEPIPGNLNLDHLFQINKSVNPEASMTNLIRTENIKGLVPPFIVLKKVNDILSEIKNSDILNSSNKSVFVEQAATHLNDFNKVQLFSKNNIETSKEFFRSLAGSAGFKMDTSKLENSMFQSPVNGSLAKIIENISNAIENNDPSREVQQSFQNQNKAQQRNQQMQQEQER